MDDILPFLSSLLTRLKYTPTEDEMSELKKSTMIEMRVFFEAAALGISDEELFDKILVFYRMRAKGDKAKFKLTDPLADADRKLSKPAPAPKPAAPAPAPKPVVSNEIPAAMKNAEADRRTWNKEIDVIISPGTSSFAVNVHNRAKQSFTVRLDFTASEGIKVTAEPPHRVPEPLHLESTVEAGARVVIGRVVPTSLTAPISLSYTLQTIARAGAAPVTANCTGGSSAPTGFQASKISGTSTVVSASAPAAPAAAPAAKTAAPSAAPAKTAAAAAAPSSAAAEAKPAPAQSAPVESKPKATVAASVVTSAPAPAPAPAPQQKPKTAAATPAPAAESDDEEEPQTERKNLGENLDLVIDNDGHHGYVITVDNTDPRDYLVVLDMSASVNLKLKPKGDFVSVDGQTATFVVKAKSQLTVFDMPVDNFELQMCELRYKASIRKQ